MSIKVAPRRSRWASILRIGLIVAFCLVATLAIYVRNVTKPRATPPPPLPVPNAYDEFVRAGQSIKGRVPNDGNFQQAKPEDLRAWLDQNAEAIKITRAVIGKSSRVPLVYSQDMQIHMDRSQAVRQLGRLISAEGELALIEKRPDDAARSFRDVIQLGPAIGRGGLYIDALVGVAIETIGQMALARTQSSLGPEQLRGAIATLVVADTTRDTPAIVWNTEDYWVEQTFDIPYRLMFKLSGAEKQLRAPANQSAIKAFQRVELSGRRLMVDMAAHLYVLDHKSAPDDVSMLVPVYLSDIPKNPATGESLSITATAK